MFNSILDNDLYKFSMSFGYMMKYPNAVGTFQFVDRNKEIKADENYLRDLKEYMRAEFEHMSVFPEEQMEWAIKTMVYIPRFYWEWLSQFQFDIDKLEFSTTEEGILSIKATDLMYRVTLYEVPVLAMVSEFNNIREGRKVNSEKVLMDVVNRTIDKAMFANEHNLLFSEFGTRRRFSSIVQEQVVVTLKHNCKTCTGTSNVYLAWKYDMKPIGTVAHEWVMFHGATYGYSEANYLAYDAWKSVYNGSLGIALTDTYTTEAFFRNFSADQALLYQGIRQDSGDEFKFADNAVAYYKRRSIDPSSKTIVFSNALTIQKFLPIRDYCDKLGIKSVAGIGTSLSCDTLYNKSYNIVMKLVSCQLTPEAPIKQCIKISDDLGKHMGSDKEFERAMYELQLSNTITK